MFGLLSCPASKKYLSQDINNTQVLQIAIMEFKQPHGNGNPYPDQIMPFVPKGLLGIIPFHRIVNRGWVMGMDSLVRTKTSRLNGLNVSIPCRVLTQQHRVSSTTFSCLELSCPTVSLYAWNILNTEPQIKKKSLAGELEVAQEPNQDRLASGDCSGSGYGLQLHNSYSCNHHGSILENGGT